MKKPPTPKEINVLVLRAFRLGGEEVQADTVVSLDYRFAMELISANKVVRTTEPQRGPRARRSRAPAAAKAAAAPAAVSTAGDQAADSALDMLDTDHTDTPVDPAQGE